MPDRATSDTWRPEIHLNALIVLVLSHTAGNSSVSNLSNVMGFFTCPFMNQNNLLSVFYVRSSFLPINPLRRYVKTFLFLS